MMKQQQRLWVIALIMIFGIVTIGCSDDEPNGPNNMPDPKPFVGNNMKSVALPESRDAARAFYVNVLGATLLPGPAAHIDIFQFPNNTFLGIHFLASALPTEQMIGGGTWLELQAKDSAALQNTITAYGIQPIDVGIPGFFFFIAPGGQVFRVNSAGGNAAAEGVTAIIGNNMKSVALPENRDAARAFYVNVLGATLLPGPADFIDIFQFPNDVFVGIHFLPSALTAEQQIAGGTWLELQTEDAEAVKGDLADNGVQPIDVGIPDFYFFAAPGGQIYRLVEAE